MVEPLRQVRRKIMERTHSAGRGRPEPKPPRLVGIVEEFGRTQVVGWVAVSRDAPPVSVTLMLGDIEIASTLATVVTDRTNWGQIRRFRFRLKDLWQYTHKQDKITVRVNGRSLPIAGHGMYVVPKRNAPAPLDELRAKLSEGYVFSHLGRLQVSKARDLTWQQQVLGLYQRVRVALKERTGLDAFVIYGTLLGLVREGQFIGHDIDLDAAYISTHDDGPRAARELQHVAYALIDAGLFVRCMPEALHIWERPGGGTRIDLFHLYFDANGVLRFPFGVAGSSTVTAADWRGLREVDFAGQAVLAPVTAEALVEHIYGVNWREPAPGFDWDLDRTDRAADGVLPAEITDEVYWVNLYAHYDFDTPSPFADRLRGFPGGPGRVIDLGCGDGRDALAFAADGRSVLGLDYAGNAIARATGKAAERGLGAHAQFQVCDVRDPAALRAALAEARSGTDPVLFYLRLFLNSLTAEVAADVLTAIAEQARPGDVFAAEFRTEADTDTKKVHWTHYRRFIDPGAFRAELTDRYGFGVLDEAESTGLSPYSADGRVEDPVLYRVIARRAGAAGQPGFSLASSSATGTPASSSGDSVRRYSSS
jgi:SAM-dependent methyltransferase